MLDPTVYKRNLTLVAPVEHKSSNGVNTMTHNMVKVRLAYRKGVGYFLFVGFIEWEKVTENMGSERFMIFLSPKTEFMVEEAKRKSKKTEGRLSQEMFQNFETNKKGLWWNEVQKWTETYGGKLAV